MADAFSVLGSAPINSAVTAGRSKFLSLFRASSSKAFSEDPNRNPRSYVHTRGILIGKKYLEKDVIDFSNGYYFQFNPMPIRDEKTTSYEERVYAGLGYVDYVWNGGGTRNISFQLFMDNTPQSKSASFRPSAYNSQEANQLVSEGVTYGRNGEVISRRSTRDTLLNQIGIPVASGPSAFTYTGDAFSNSRVHERGILPEVELLQSFLYPEPLDDQPSTRFAEGGIVSPIPFRPPQIAVFSYGPIYLEGIIRSAPVTYTLFDSDLTPIRATVDVEFSVFEYTDTSRKIEWTPLR